MKQPTPGAMLVAAAGFATTIQDAGRSGWQRFGVPVSGALDRIALAAANIVAGNPPDTAGLECLYAGCTLILDGDSARVALAGDGAMLEIAGADASGAVRSIPNLESARINRGDKVSVRLTGPSISAYLAVEGGIAAPLVMGSRSTYVRAAIGGIEGRAVRSDDRLPLMHPTVARRTEMSLRGIDLTPCYNVRVVLGPQHDRFTPHAIATLAASEYIVGQASDRMGLRLDGPRLEHIDGADILSDGIPAGAIQVPGNGLPIVMLADRQTTGGYTKIATVASADLPALGRLAPGCRLRFEIVDIAVAEQAARDLHWEIVSWRDRLQPCRPSLAELQTALFANNLVSGVADATALAHQEPLNV